MPLVVRVYSYLVPFQRHVQPAGKSRGDLGFKAAWEVVGHMARYQRNPAMLITRSLTAETRQGPEVLRRTRLQFDGGEGHETCFCKLVQQP